MHWTKTGPEPSQRGRLRSLAGAKRPSPRRLSWIALGRPAHLTCMETYTSPAEGLEALLSIEALSEYLGVPVATIYDWRVDGKGPRGIRVGRHLRFAVSDVRAWLDQNRDADRNLEGR